MSDVVIHRLLNKDADTRTGNCSVCGFVAISKAGNGFMCGEKKKAGQKNWRERNPEKSAADRRRKSEHELFARDYVKLTAECAKCGPVSMQAWGRGYTCGTRAAELRSVQQSTPAQPCRECWIIDGSRVYMVDGSCPRCSDERLYDLGSQLRDAEFRRDDREVPGGFVVWDVESFEHESMPGYESAVPGWRTVGTDRPWNQV